MPLTRFDVAGGVQDALLLHLAEDSVNGAFVICRIQTHGTGEVREGFRALLDQDATGEDPHG